MRMRGLLALAVVLFATSGCGRYGPPVPPEAVAPAQVETLKVSAVAEGVRFSWNSPQSDRRGESLKSLDGYRVYRKSIEKPSDVTDSNIEFTLLGTLEDTHLEALEQARAEARAAGRPAHRARVDAKLTTFEFLDKEVAPGSTYIYKVVPFNQGDVESEAFRLVRVLWRGDSSEISSVDGTTISVEDEFSEF